MLVFYLDLRCFRVRTGQFLTKSTEKSLELCFQSFPETGSFAEMSLILLQPLIIDSGVHYTGPVLILALDHHMLVQDSLYTGTPLPPWVHLSRTAPRPCWYRCPVRAVQRRGRLGHRAPNGAILRVRLVTPPSGILRTRPFDPLI